MDFKVFITVFVAVFVAELGDKTQLATLLFASDREISKLTVFSGASIALVLTSALGVLLGSVISQHLDPKVMSVVAGIGFVLIGVWSLYQGLAGI